MIYRLVNSSAAT